MRYAAKIKPYLARHPGKLTPLQMKPNLALHLGKPNLALRAMLVNQVLRPARHPDNSSVQSCAPSWQTKQSLARHPDTTLTLRAIQASQALSLAHHPGKRSQTLRAILPNPSFRLACTLGGTTPERLRRYWPASGAMLASSSGLGRQIPQPRMYSSCPLRALAG